MNEPKRFDAEKYARMKSLSEKVKEKRPVEGEIIHRLVAHVDELYEYIDYLMQGEMALDDDALERLGVPEARTQPAQTGRRRNRNRNNNRQSPRHPSNRQEGWQAPRTDLSWMDDYENPPF